MLIYIFSVPVILKCSSERIPSVVEGFFYGMEVGVGMLIGSGGVGIFCVGPVPERAMGLGQENLWNEF